MRIVVILGLSLGLWSNAAIACSASLLASPSEDLAPRVRVGKVELALPRSERPPSELRSWTPRKGELLVAYVVVNRHQPSGSDTLWRIRCAAPRLEPVVQVPQADFGHGALSADGHTFYFSSERGISSLDLQTHQIQSLTTAPALTHCDTNDSPHQFDVVDHLDRDGHLVFDRGGPCGYEGDWESKRLTLQLGGKTPVVHKPHPIASIALDAANTLWLSDGQCTEPSTHGTIWRTNDQGAHWQRIKVPMLTPQPVQQIVNQPNLLVVLTASCGSSAHVDPAWVYTSTDHGNTWKPITPPPGIPAHNNEPDSEQDPLSAIALGANTLTVWGTDSTVDGVTRWLSTDAGRSWQRAATPLTPPTPARSLMSGPLRYQATDDGLLLVRDGTTTRVFPSPVR